MGRPDSAPSASDGKDSKEEKDIKDSSSSWCSFASVLDVEAPEPLLAPPFVPPVSLYLEEALLCIRHGLGDASVPRSDASGLGTSSHLPRQGLSCTGQQKVKQLHAALTKGPAIPSGCSLFWLALGAIFGCLPDCAFAAVRAELGKNWHLLMLQVEELMPHHRNTRDWVVAAAPFVFAQAVYRLLCDGFEEDRKHFVAQGSKLIQKIALVVHFELTGFQLTPDSVKQALRRLFLPRVIACPHINQRDYLKGVRRQEVLESMKDAARMLDFGRKDVATMDKSQLEHILQGRMQQLQPTTPSSTKNTPVIQIEHALIREDLSVDRHLHLNDIGTTLMERHFDVLGIKNRGGREDEDEYEDAPPSPVALVKRSEEGVSRKESSEHMESECPTEPGSPDGTNNRGASHRRLASTLPTLGTIKWLDGGASSDEGNSARGPERSSTTAAVGQRLRVVTSGDARTPKTPKALTKFDHREAATLRKVNEAKARRLRQDLLQQKIVGEPLPPEICTRELNTDWVSPALEHMMGESGDRGVLNKTKADSYHLKMFTPTMQARTLSMPALKAVARPQSKGHAYVDSSKRRQHDASTVSQTASAKEEVTGSMAGGSSRPNAKQSTAKDADLGRDVSTATLATNASSPSLLAWSPPGMTPVLMDTAARISGKVICQRLEGQAKAFRQNSFANYIKEYDVFKGQPKQSFAEKRLRDEEDAFLRKLDSLVGGPPRRMIHLKEQV